MPQQTYTQCSRGEFATSNTTRKRTVSTVSDGISHRKFILQKKQTHIPLAATYAIANDFFFLFLF